MSYGPHKQKRKCESAHGGMRYCIFPPHHGSCFPNGQRHQLSESMAIQSVLKTQRYKNTDAPDTTTQPKQAVQDTGGIHGLIFHFFARAGKTESWKRYKCLVIYGGLRIRIPIPIHCTWSMSSPGAVSKFILFRLIIPFVLQLQVFFALPCLALPCFVSLPQGFCGVTALSKSAVAKTSSWLNDSILCPPTHESWRILGEHIAQHMQFCQNSRTRLAAGK